MKSLFPGHYPHSEDESDRIWKESVVVLDTNAVLNIYRYTPKTREAYLGLLRSLREANRLWIPYQVAEEFHRNRSTVINGQHEAYDKAIKSFTNLIVNIEDASKSKDAKQTDPISQDLVEARNIVIVAPEEIYKAIALLQERKKLLPLSKPTEPLHDHVAELFEGIVGPCPTGATIETWHNLARSRYAEDTPPGFMDSRGKDAKPEPRCFGDAVLWFQILDFASESSKSVLLVTDETKPDWWETHSNGQKAPEKLPHPALLNEFKNRVRGNPSNADFWMSSCKHLLEKMPGFLSAPVSPEAVEEAELVARHEELQEEDEEPEETALTQRSPSHNKWDVPRYDFGRLSLTSLENALAPYRQWEKDWEATQKRLAQSLSLGQSKLELPKLPRYQMQNLDHMFQVVKRHQEDMEKLQEQLRRIPRF